MLRNGPFWTWEWAVLDVSWGRFGLFFFYHWGRSGFSGSFSTFIEAVLTMGHFGRFPYKSTFTLHYIFCILYRKLSSEWLAETQNLCKNVLHITSSPSPSYFDKDAVLLHQFSSAVNLQLSDATKPLAVREHSVICIVCTYCLPPSSLEMGALCFVLFAEHCTYILRPKALYKSVKKIIIIMLAWICDLV